ncbi:hypothetical protein E2C01_026987 [Portunus trituberculatus]|uniref:Uncharacterized protein n=1 Tax=Portunus trituberculatus TaxID=210409 RepID=A0A5B7EHL0_PORTR|nr:hypothetical protein [Portunus trituberculatus]
MVVCWQGKLCLEGAAVPATVQLKKQIEDHFYPQIKRGKGQQMELVYRSHTEEDLFQRKHNMYHSTSTLSACVYFSGKEPLCNNNKLQ